MTDYQPIMFVGLGFPPARAVGAQPVPIPQVSVTQFSWPHGQIRPASFSGPGLPESDRADY